MNETAGTPEQLPAAVGHPVGGLSWLLSGAVLPLGSLAFYRLAARKSTGSAVLFLFLFALVLSVLTTIAMGLGMFSVIGGIRQAYDSGQMPEITIHNGIATVNGPQSVILLDDQSASGGRILVAIDTTGQTARINSSRYEQGILLTRTALHLLNTGGRYQTLPLSELNAGLQIDPIVLNADTVAQAWGILSVAIVLGGFIFMIAWNFLVRLMIIALLALLIWGIVSLIKPGTGFGPILICGLYAVIPAIYITHLFSRSGVVFPGLQTIVLVPIWAVGLFGALASVKTLTDDQPARLWTAWIGLPLLLVFIVDIFRPFPAPWGPAVLWGLALVTIFALAAIRLFLRFRKPAPESTVP